MGKANKHSYTSYTLLGTQKEREGRTSSSSNRRCRLLAQEMTKASSHHVKNLETQGLPIGVHSSTLLLQRKSYYRSCCMDQHTQQTYAGCSYVLAASNRLLTNTVPKGSLQDIWM